MVARVVAVSGCARTEVARPLHAHRILMIWHAESLGMSRFAVHGVVSSVGEGRRQRGCQGGGVHRWGHSKRPGTFSPLPARMVAGLGPLRAAGDFLFRAGTCHACGDRNPVPDGVDCPRSEGHAPGRAAMSPAVQQCPRRRRLSPAPQAATSGAEPGRATTRARTVMVRALGLERVTGIEPALSAWEAEVLPLNYTRVAPVDVRPRCVRKSNPDSGRLRKSACGGASRTASATPSPTTLAHGFPDVFICVVSA